MRSNFSVVRWFWTVLQIGTWLAVSMSGAFGQDVAVSWNKARVYVPGVPEVLSPSRVDELVQKPLPVVVYMHGCSGITEHNDVPWARFIRDLGFVVVQPDSLARSDRGASCDPATARHFSSTVHALRLAEIEFALNQLRSVNWADSKNVFLMGHSEGAIATARSRLQGFRGGIISSWTCTAPYASYDGIFLPPNTPILSIGWDADPWYVGTRYAGSCAAKFAGRTNAMHVQLQGREHTTAHTASARDEVARFLKSNLLEQ